MYENSSQSSANHTDHFQRDESTLLLLFAVNNVIAIISVFGLITNSINLIVFSKLWSRDTISISLFSVSLSDFFIALTGVLACLAEMPPVQQFILHNIYWLPSDFNAMFIVAPHIIFTRITLNFTAFITIERCVCVAIPLKVKTIFTRQVVQLILVVCILLSVTGYAPLYFFFRYTQCFFPPLNRYVYCAIPHYVSFEALRKWFMPLSVWLFYGLQFFVIIVCTAILIIVLIKKSKWRQDAASSTTTTGNSSTKERRVIRMMVMISSLFIVCNIPMTINWIWHEIDPEFAMHGALSEAYSLSFTVSFFFEAINSSMNLFIYYTNSSNYIEMFDKIFKIKRETKEKRSTT